MDTLKFSAGNLIWIIIESSRIEEIVDEVKDIYGVTESWVINSPEEHWSMWNSQVLCFELGPNLTIICGWGIDTWSTPQKKTQLVVKKLSEVFGKAKLYYNGEGRGVFGWIGYENGMSVDTLLFQVNEDDYDDEIESTGPILLDDQNQVLLVGKIKSFAERLDKDEAVELLISNFKQHFPEVFPPFTVQVSQDTFYYLHFEFVIRKQITLIVTNPEMRELALLHRK